MDLYKIPVGDICSDADELVRRLNAAEQRISASQRRRWRVERPRTLYQLQFANPLAHHFSYYQFSHQSFGGLL